MIVSLKTWPYVCIGRDEVVLVIEVYLGAAIKKRRTEVNRKVKHLGSLPRILRKEVGNKNIAQEISSTVYEVTMKTNNETDNQNRF